ncbi:hypothetical protein Zmor_028489 [Zophobas morio]|uniref:Uncharacterized protein n=2 Tax=Zophobas morio TaxID=2755281 RepID=A0AA38M018_9CUCU|nr:hypothetical protein Zmor_028489 [Zophobas morio]
MDAEKLLDNNKLSTRTTSKNPQSPQKPTEEEASSPFFFHLSDYSLQNRLLSGKECDFYNYFTCPASQRDSLEQWKDKRIKLMEMFRQARRQALKKEGMREKAT